MFPKGLGNKLSSVNTEGCGFASRNAVPMKKLSGSKAVVIYSGRHWVFSCLLFFFFFKLGFCTAGAF